MGEGVQRSQLVHAGVRSVLGGGFHLKIVAKRGCWKHGYVAVRSARQHANDIMTFEPVPLKLEDAFCSDAAPECGGLRADDRKRAGRDVAGTRLMPYV